MIDITKNIEALGDAYVTELVLALKKMKKQSSGKLIKSISKKFMDGKDIDTILIIAEDYLQYVDQGRKKGSYPPIKPLLKWASIKGLNKGAAYAVQQHIFKFGIKPTNVIDKTLINVERKGITKFEADLANTIEDQLYKILTNR